MSDRNTLRRDGLLFPVPMAANTEIFGGHIVCVNAAGYAVPGANGLTPLGVSDGYTDNSAGNAGDEVVLVSRGRSFNFANSTSDPVTQVMVGQSCYIADSTTVQKTAAGTALGTVLGVDVDGVWVLIK
ncbi:hypothetical protein [Serratia sp. 14-2641]|uniref:hypothetical protein n=1 Tax=Serratia sp. 14-2641 TaxID=1841657 RepID=UPI00081007CD|nr:hypothetical protein [Serratia sp. 14-2641]OCJ24600.1 hypothetical protein A6U95_10830 [Serratia sp. 14-2641]